jgi:uncharacterized membrane protein HdeD (DUF308 family)
VLALNSWGLPAGRGALSLALGLAITFTGGHTAQFGLVAFGVFAVLSGLLVLAATFGRGAVTEARTAFRAHGVMSIIAGTAALALPGGGIGYLVWVLSGWAILTGALELVSGLRARGRVAAWTDWVAVGTLTLLLGIVTLVIPPDISQSFEGEKDVTGLLTSPIIIVGVLSAWAIVTGVLQAISAASPKRAPAPAAVLTGTAS